MRKHVDQMLTLGEIVELGYEKAEPTAWDYLVGGSETESTLRRNRQGLDKLAFRPRVLRNVNDIDTTCEICDISMRLPVFLAPMGSLQSLDETGAIATALAAKEFGIVAFLSSVCHPGIEKTMKEVGGNLMFQLYVRGDQTWVMDQLDMATDLGYKAFCLTVDTAVYGRRERDKMRGFTPKARIDVTGFNFQAGLDWDLVDKIKSRSRLPLILKGIATKEDAQLAITHGIDVIYTSNHGGRQLDYGRGSIEVLPEIVTAAEGKATVFMDGAIYRGTDILKAICLGADAVGIGRLCGYGLAAGGVQGLRRVLELLEEECINAMANLGVTELSELNEEFICHSSQVNEPSVFSAFPLINIPRTEY